MKRSLFLVAAWAALSSVGVGQETEAEKVVAPFLTDSTLAVGRLDLDQFEFSKVINEFGKLAPISMEQRLSVGLAVETIRTGLRGAGFKNVYVLADIAEIDNSVVLGVLPISDPSKAQGALNWLKLIPNSSAEIVGDVILVGTPGMLANAKSSRAKADLSELRKGLATLPDAPVAIVSAPTTALRRAIEELSPNLPAEIGGGSSLVLSRGLVHSTLRFELTPDIRMGLQHRCASAAATKEMEALTRSVVTKLATDLGKELNIDLSKLADTLAIKTTDSAVDLQLRFAEPAVASLFKASVNQVANHSETMISVNNLKQIALGWHVFADEKKTLPPAYLADANGKPLLSWRVMILPYLEQQSLYGQFRLNEPWDSEHNRKLIAKMPNVFRSPLSKAAAGKTTYLAPRGKGLITEPQRSVDFRSITDGTSRTLMIVEVNDAFAVEWTKPEDWNVDLKTPFQGLRKSEKESIRAAFGDGSVMTLPKSVDAKTLHHLLTIAGGEIVDLPAK